MFFPRLRSQAKWAFVFLILVFGGGFVFLGVGSGGLDLGQLIRDAFGNKGHSSGSVSGAEARVRLHPGDPAAYRNLADVLQKKGRVDEAIIAWTRYVSLKPRDTSALRLLGQLELGQADRYFREAQLASAAQAEASAGSAFVPSSSGKFGRAIGQDPIATAVTSKLSGEFQMALAKYQSAAQTAVATYKQIVRVSPNDQQALFSLAQAADTLHQTAVAVHAYKRLLEFKLDPATAAQVRQRIKTLGQFAQPHRSGG
jgi:tetratricopeptide (TPR) repeat protein